MDSYLKPNIKIEPLIWRWYAWPYLIPPSTAACNIVERHLKIMQSYVQNPQMHAHAVKDPKLLGGPFIDLDGQNVNEINSLIDLTKKDCEKLIVLNNAIKDLDRVLQTEAQGDSLEDFYAKVPDPLKGLVEIVYNINNRPSIRLIESLIYKNYYTTEHQAIALSEINDDFRQFVLSTPRLEREDEVYLKVAFSDPKLSRLFEMREKPHSLEDIKQHLEIPVSKQKLFESFFTTNPPDLPDDRNYKGDGVRIRYFGHACVLVQTKTVSILFDPVISYPIQSNQVPRYTIKDLPDRIDYVVITHNHQDHLMFETLLQLKHKIGHVVFPGNNYGALEDPSVKLILQHVGFSSLIELREMEDICLEEGEMIGF